jgi:hypothetical protein
VFKVAAQLNGVPYIPSASVLENTINNDSSAAASVPSASAAKKVLPIFIIMQLALSGLIIAGAFWLSLPWDDALSKSERQKNRYTTLIPAQKGHKKNNDSIGSVGSDVPFATELERGRDRQELGHLRADSATDLTAGAALMGTSTPRRLSQGSLQSLDDPVDPMSLRRVLDAPRPASGFLEHRRTSLFLD